MMGRGEREEGVGYYFFLLLPFLVLLYKAD